MTDRPIWCALMASVLTLLLAGCGAQKKEEEAPKPVVTVKLEKARRQDFVVAIEAPASLFPREQASIAARVTAPIRELKVRKGDSVHAGQVIAVLDNRDSVAQRADAQAALADAQATLTRTRSGTLPGDIDRGQGAVDTAQAALNQAQKNYDRRNELFREGAIPNRDLLSAQTDLAQAKTASQVAVRGLNLLKTQTGQSDVASAQAKVDSAKARLELANAQLQFTEIRAPFNGTVTEQMMYPGDMAGAGTPMFTIMNLSVLNARAQVPESQAGVLRRGQPCSFASADAPDQDFAGRITVINGAVDAARRTVEVWCEIPGGKSALRANLFGQVRIVIRTDRDRVTVPLTALQFNEGTSTGAVMVADSHMVAHKRDVETGEQAHGEVEILKGLEGAETVITEGSYNLADGTQVQVAGEKGGDKKGEKE